MLTSSELPATTPESPSSPRGTGLGARDRVGLVLLLAGTAFAYLRNITVNGTGNAFYSAAVWSATRSWKALLFGSLDPNNFITVDKPPVSQWVMGVSARLFGFGSAAELVPQALIGVATVGLLYGAVRRLAGPAAGLLAGVCLALMPVAALMFRFDKPDPVMVLLMTTTVYALARALPAASTRWLVLGGVALGFAFLAKMLEGLMVAPALCVTYLVAAPNPIRARIVQLVAALAALVVSSGWYVALTMLWPASSRPYMAGSTDNSFMNLVLGYNGFGRVLGHRPHWNGPVHRGVVHGPARLFTGEFGVEISWLLPTALLALVLLVAARWHAARTDPIRAAALLFGLWLIIDGGVLSYMTGIVIPYYTLSVAPAVAGLSATGACEMWRARDTRFGRIGLAALVFVSGFWGFWLLHRNGAWLPPLRWIVLAVSVCAAAALLLPLLSRRVAAATLAAALTGAIGGSTVYTLATLGQPHQIRLTAGPAVHDNGRPSLASNPRLVAALTGTHSNWSAAVDHSENAAELELASRTPVMAIGGFGGKDPVPTLNQFIGEVRDHRVTYYLADHADHRPTAHTDIKRWVAAHFTPVQLGDVTMYDLSGYRG
ncbi:ArnT family glycosyltransferase [Nocardia jiangxiensis]|uniref:ArnT family glycosyltransferase n=1 Tax=Nocardia jiangxiensis TaxID=282685 RepID=A0ABW6SFQ2_9NOCA|nr:glycosyltransferase family 39 protein [Nocardia jiangxiensis]